MVRSALGLIDILHDDRYSHINGVSREVVNAHESLEACGDDMTDVGKRKIGIRKVERPVKEELRTKSESRRFCCLITSCRIHQSRKESSRSLSTAKGTTVWSCEIEAHAEILLHRTGAADFDYGSAVSTCMPEVTFKAWKVRREMVAGKDRFRA